MVDPVGVAGTYGGAAPLSQAELRAYGGLGGSLGFDPTGAQDLVYMGGAAAPVVPRGTSAAAADYAIQQSKAKQFIPVEAAIGAVAWFSPAEKKRLAELTNRYYNYDTAGQNTSLTNALWKDAVEGANSASKWRDTPVSPWEFLEQSIINQSGTVGGGGGGGGGGAGAYTGPVTTVRLTDPDTAMTLIDQSLAGSLGRQATQGEKGKFLTALREYEMRNPTVTTGDKTGSVTTGGSNAQVFAQRYAESQEGVAEFQAATTYLDAFMDALGNPVK